MNDRISTIAPPVVVTSLAMATAGCTAVEGIFKAGVWVGAVAVARVLCLGVAATSTLRP